MKLSLHALLYIIPVFVCVCCEPRKAETPPPTTVDTIQTARKQTFTLPEPYATESVKKFSNVVGWGENITPAAPQGFTVTRFADGLKNPRWIYVAPNGDIFVSEANTETKVPEKVGNVVSGKNKSQNLGKSANRITLFKDTDNNGTIDQRHVYLSELNQPFGMLILNGSFYVANTDGIWQYPYQEGQTTMRGTGKKILSLPAGGYNNHWTRNIIANANGTKIYVSVGSGSNSAEHGFENEIRRANILEINPDGTGERVVAAGLRNPVGMDLQPGTHTLWTAVNERDDLGDELVPDYITSVKDGGFYGWPYTYFGTHDDPAVKEPLPDSLQQVIVPDVPVGAHTASLGLAFYDARVFPGHYHGGAFVGQHGSWNRSRLSGYKVIFVPFANGVPGTPEDFLTGFVKDEATREVYGRPVCVAVAPDGSLLVADDASNIIWRVSVTQPQ